GIPSWQVDGMDPLAVHLAQEQALKHMRAGRGPTMIETEVYRYYHQNGPYPGSAFGYRSKEEEAKWRERDPIPRVEQEMVRRELLSQEQANAVRSRARDAMEVAAAGFLEDLPGGRPGQLRIKED